MNRAEHEKFSDVIGAMLIIWWVKVERGPVSHSPSNPTKNSSTTWGRLEAMKSAV